LPVCLSPFLPPSLPVPLFLSPSLSLSLMLLLSSGVLGSALACFSLVYVVV
jgi:hypothetical protein